MLGISRELTRVWFPTYVTSLLFLVGWRVHSMGIGCMMLLI
jgi:hypothetical protein